MDMASNLDKLTIRVPIFDEKNKPPPRFDPKILVEKEKPKFAWVIEN